MPAPAQVVAGYLRLVVAPNAGPMTLSGTNTWIVGDPRRGPVVVVDPGPNDESHLDRVEAACPRGIADIVLTHRHIDHSEAAPELARRARCGVRAADPGFRLGTEGLAADEVVCVPDADMVVVPTPGHTSDSTSLLVRGEDGVRWLLSGDTVLGRGTTVIASPDGDLEAYLASLEVLMATVSGWGVREILPGHGPRVAEPLRVLAWYADHRRERLEQVRAAVAAGATTTADVVAAVYADLDPELRPGAEQSVVAQLEFLSRTGS
jgi:glyoxylase-like metal-dependent hydrolase (beta-lactamase superfamily II)